MLVGKILIKSKKQNKTEPFHPSWQGLSQELKERSPRGYKTMERLLGQEAGDEGPALPATCFKIISMSLGPSGSV